MQRVGNLLRSKVHVSWIFAVVCAGFLLGLILTPHANEQIWANYSWLVVAIFLSIPVCIIRARWLLFVACFVGLLLGFVRGSTLQNSLKAYEQYIGKSITLTGKVSEDVDRANESELRIRLKDIVIDGNVLKGQIWLSLKQDADIRRSDIVTVKGQVREGFGSFNAVLGSVQLVGVEKPAHNDIAREVRDGFADSVREGIKEPQASLGIGFLTGQRNSLPADLDDQLRIVGLTHIVVASGYNLTILVRFMRRFFAKHSKYLAAASAGFMIVGFMAVTGFSPSMARAGLVAGLSLLAWYYGRAFHPVALLLFAAAATAGLNPGFIWGDLGWYLSFAAFVGVIILSPLVHRYFWGEQKPGVLRQILVDTTCAQLLTMPMIAFVFGEYSLYALPANLLILPLIPLVMVLVFVAGLLSLVIPGLATVFGWPAQQLLSYMTWLVEWMANRPHAQGDIAVSAIVMAIAYGVIIGLCIWLWRKTKFNFRTSSIVE